MNIFVTGGSQGIGREIVKLAAERNMGVAFTYFQHKESALEILKNFKGKNIKAYELDVRNSKNVDAVTENVLNDFDEIDAVVNNAGIAISNLALNISDEDFDNVMKTNLYGPFFVIRSFLAYFAEKKKGNFVNIGSIDQGGARGNSSYSASKAGLSGLSASIAKEYGKMGIRSNLIVPSFVNTKMVKNDHPSKILGQFFKDYSLTGEYINPVDIAEFVLFLCSEDSKAINGSALPITAGIDWRP